MTFKLGEFSAALRKPCWRKQAWESAGAARAQMRSLLKRGKEKDADRINVYHCPHCGLYHVGHQAKKRGL